MAVRVLVSDHATGDEKRVGDIIIAKPLGAVWGSMETELRTLAAPDVEASLDAQAAAGEACPAVTLPFSMWDRTDPDLPVLLCRSCYRFDLAAQPDDGVYALGDLAYDPAPRGGE